MTAQARGSAQSDGFELHGLTQAEAQDAINRYAKHVQLRVQARNELRTTVCHAYVDDLPLISEATQKQALRTVHARIRLIDYTQVRRPIRALQNCGALKRAVHARG